MVFRMMIWVEWYIISAMQIELTGHLRLKMALGEYWKIWVYIILPFVCIYYEKYSQCSDWIKKRIKMVFFPVLFTIRIVNCSTFCLSTSLACFQLYYDPKFCPSIPELLLICTCVPEYSTYSDYTQRYYIILVTYLEPLFSMSFLAPPTWETNWSSFVGNGHVSYTSFLQAFQANFNPIIV